MKQIDAKEKERKGREGKFDLHWEKGAEVSTISQIAVFVHPNRSPPKNTTAFERSTVLTKLCTATLPIQKKV